MSQFEVAEACPAMASAKHRTPEYRAEKERLRPIVEAGEAECAEAICLVEQDGGTRWIPPGSSWHLAHDRGDVGFLGPAHGRCNDSEGGKRGNEARSGPKWWPL